MDSRHAQEMSRARAVRRDGDSNALASDAGNASNLPTAGRDGFRQPGREADGSAAARAGANAGAAPGRTIAQRIVREKPVVEMSIPADASPRFLEALSQQLGPDRYARYAEARLEAKFTPQNLKIVVSSNALADLLRRRYMTELHQAAERAIGRGIAIQIESNEVAVPAPLPGARTANPVTYPAGTGKFETGEYAGEGVATTGAGGLATRIGGRDAELGDARREAGARAGQSGSRAAQTTRYKLEDFVVGDSNRLAYNAAQRIAEGEADQGAMGGYNLLFVHGPCGVGKTHLAQGAALRYRERHPGAVVRVTSGEAFMTEFVAAIRDASGANTGGAAGNSSGIERFRKNYRKVDLLFIDDVQTLANKQATQAELLHTFEEIARSGARVVLVSDQHPRQLEKFSPQLVSRFLAGMVAGIAPPDEELTRRLIKTLALRRGLAMDESAIGAIATRARLMPGAASGLSVREIEGILTRIEAVHRLLPDPSGNRSLGSGAINLLTIERALGSASGQESGKPAQGVAGRPVRIDTIITQTCRYLSVDPSDLSARTRHKRVVLARAVITHLARQYTTMSFPEIARALGRPNHSTVITAYQRLAAQMAASEMLTSEHVPEPMTVNALVDRLSSVVKSPTA